MREAGVVGISEFRGSMPPEQIDPCERCGTELVLMGWTRFRVDEYGELHELDPIKSQWYDFEWWTHPETKVRFRRAFLLHIPQRCREARRSR